MKFKTIHNELSYNKTREKKDHVLVRSNQTPKLRSIIEQASRGTAPSNIKFSTLANDGFLPPQYSREDITALHARYKSLSSEREVHAKRTQEPTKQEPTKQEIPEQG